MMLLGAMAFSSCDMDLKPVGTLDEETAIQNAQDLRQFRNTLYTNLRAVTSGSYIYLTDIQLDGFNGLISNGNNLSDFSYGQIYPTNQSVTNYWTNNYVMIANANALIGKAEGFMASSTATRQRSTTRNATLCSLARIAMLLGQAVSVPTSVTRTFRSSPTSLG